MSNDLIVGKLIIGGGTPEVGGKCFIYGNKLCIPLGSGGGGSTGDATTLASDIIYGKTAYIATGKVTGTIQKLSATTYTPGTLDQIISSGKYLDGSQTILGDVNLIPSNIKEGVTIFGILGTHSGESSRIIYCTNWTIISSNISARGAKSGSLSKGLTNIIPFSGLARPTINKSDWVIISDQIDLQ